MTEYINTAKNMLKTGLDMSGVRPVEKPSVVFSFKRRQVGFVKQEPFPGIGTDGNLLP